MSGPADGLDLDRLLAAALEAAAAGAHVVRTAFGTPLEIVAKGPRDWVSAADHASEDAIRAVLEAAAPGITVVGEESGGAREDIGWFVDPLDGTTNFLHGFPIVGVSVGLVAEGVPLVGVVELPLLGQVYAARAGGGATCDGRPVSVSTRPFGAAICATGFPFRRRERLPAYLEAFGRVLGECEDVRRAGAASLDLVWTAGGVYDGFFELGLGPWDVAAGAVIVREAGGVVTDWSGDDRAWFETGHIVAAPPAVHARLLALLDGNP